MSDLYQLLESLVEENLSLKHNGKEWLLNESNINYRFIYPSKKSFAFKIDINEGAFPFFSARPPQHTAKMCDFLVVLISDENDYVFSVEIKSSRNSHFEKQLRNGYYFVEWLVNLLREHGHYKKTPIYLGLLIWKPRKIPKKGTTRRNIPKLQRESVGKYKGHWKVSNQSVIYMEEYVSSYNQSQKRL